MKTAEQTPPSVSQIQRKSASSFFGNTTEQEQPFFTGKETVNKGGFFNPTQLSKGFKPSGSSRPTIQAKLTVGAPNDKYEQEADTMADKVVQRLSQSETVQHSPKNSISTIGNGGGVQTKCMDCEKEDKKHVQRKESGATDASLTIESKLSATKGSGSPLSNDTRSNMESAFGTDFSGVRVHTGSEAVQMSQDLNAHAFTHGSDVYFNSGKYNPSNTEGGRLLAHELTHTVQQEGGVIRRTPNEQNNSTAAVGSLAAPSIGAINSATGFASAGPNAVGIIAFPRASLSGPNFSIPQSLETYGHTALYVRINGRIVFTRGFSVMHELDIFRPLLSTPLRTQWNRFWGNAPVDVPSSIVNDAGMWSNTNARTMEIPVSSETAIEFVSSIPEVGAASGSTPPRYMINEGNIAEPGCVGSNCVIWAIRQIENHLGGVIGQAEEGSIANAGRGGSQGKLIQFLNSLIRGRGTTPVEPLPNATGAPIASKMPILRSLGIWGGRGLAALAPILEFWSNLRQNIPLGQNIARTGTVGIGSFALPQLYGTNPIFGAKAGGSGAGLADLAVNLANMGAHLLGAPEWVTSVTQAGAELTPSNTILSGAKGFVDIVYRGVTEGTEGLESVHKNMVEGKSGGMMQGYSMIGDLLSGNLPDIDLQAAERGDYGIFPQSGMYWGDVFSGERSITQDLGEIWDYIAD